MDTRFFPPDGRKEERPTNVGARWITRLLSLCLLALVAHAGGGAIQGCADDSVGSGGVADAGGGGSPPDADGGTAGGAGAPSDAGTGGAADASPDAGPKPIVCDYYVSGAGSDSQDGRTEQTSWQTLAKVQSESPNFAPGEIICFNGGDAFYGNLSLVDVSGTADDPITFTSYGYGKAILTGAKQITGWSTTGGNVWEASTGADQVHQVLPGDAEYRLCRSPHIQDLLTPAANYYTITSTVNATTFISSDLVGFPNLVGATAQVQGAQWRTSSRRITAFDSATGRVTLDSAPSYDADPGELFYVLDLPALLDSEGEWYFDSASNTLQIYSASEPSDVLATTLDAHGVLADQSHYLIFDDLVFRGYLQAGIYADHSDNLTVSNCDFISCHDSGVTTFLAEYTTVTRCHFQGTMMTAIDINHNQLYTRSSNSVVTHNTIVDHGLLTHATTREYEHAHAIRLQGSTHLMAHNTLENIGYNAVRMYGRNNTVEYNFVRNFCLTNHDGGALYCQSPTFADEGVRDSVVRFNIVESPDLGEDWHANGIYVDDRSSFVEVTDNVIIGPETGIFLHNNKNVTVLRNQIYGPRRQGILMVESWQGGPGEMVDNVLRENRLLLLAPGAVPLFLRNGLVDHYDFGSYDLNTYWNLASGHTAYVKIPSTSGDYYTLAAWQTLSGQDDGSTDDASVSVTTSKVVYNRESAAQTLPLSGTWTAMDGTQFADSITLEPFTGQILYQ